MPDNSEIERRTKAALEAIQHTLGTAGDEYGATLFVKHHVAELPASYWKEHLGTAHPKPTDVVGLLELRSHWGKRKLETFDFSLPGDVTNYVISVHFDQAGLVDGIEMES